MQQCWSPVTKRSPWDTTVAVTVVVAQARTPWCLIAPVLEPVTERSRWYTTVAVNSAAAQSRTRRGCYNIGWIPNKLDPADCSLRGYTVPVTFVGAHTCIPGFGQPFGSIPRIVPRGFLP